MFLTYVLGEHKKRLIETFLLSTHNICFGSEIRKLYFCYTLLTKGLSINGIEKNLLIISSDPDLGLLCLQKPQKAFYEV